MNKNLVVVASLVVVALIIVGAVTGWFGITGQFTGFDRENMREGFSQKLDIDGEKYDILVKDITQSNEVTLFIERMSTGDKQVITLTPAAGEVRLNSEMGLVSVKVVDVYTKFTSEKKAIIELKAI